MAEQENHIVRSSDGVVPDNFGAAVDVDGSLMAVGAPYADIAGSSDQGAIYVFESDGTGGWNQIKKILAPDGAAFDQLGGAVAIDGDTIVAGAVGAAVGANSSEGAAYVFEKTGPNPGDWTETRVLVASDPGLSAYFGRQVSVLGDTAVVGATGASSKGKGYRFDTGRRDRLCPAGQDTTAGAWADTIVATLNFRGDEPRLEPPPQTELVRKRIVRHVGARIDLLRADLRVAHPGQEGEP